MVKKPGKVLCCMFLFTLAILRVYSAQNLAKYIKGGYEFSHNLPIEALRLCNSYIVYEQKTKGVHQGEGPSIINLSLFVCYFDVYRAS